MPSVPVAALGTREAGGDSRAQPLLSDRKTTEVLGTFWVKQTHLGFCPADIMLQVRPKSLALLNDDYVVVEYQFQNIVLWTQSRSSITLLLQSNLKRVMLQARGRSAARKIAVMLHDATQELEQEILRKRSLWGLDSEDSMDGSGDNMQGQSSAFDSVDAELEPLDSVRSFRVKQTFLTDHPQHVPVFLNVGKDGLSLVDESSGTAVWSCDWFHILMWRADGASMLLVLNQTNRQIELTSQFSQEIATVMTDKAMAVQQSRRAETHERHSFGRTQHLPKVQLEFRRQMLTFEPATLTPNEKWGLTDSAGFRRIFSLKSQQSLVESVRAREQLQAVFNQADTDGSGSLDVGEVKHLLSSLNIFTEDDKEYSTKEVELMLIDMDAFGNEVTFDGFVAWALGSTNAAQATKILKKRVDHRKKEVAAVGQIFDQLDDDGDGMLDRGDFKGFLIHVGLALNDQESHLLWGSLDRDRSGEIGFQEFYDWYSRPTADYVTGQVQRAIRMTRLLINTKGAMVYAVDQGNLRARDSLRKLFDCVDRVGTGLIEKEDLMAVVKDLSIEADEYDMMMALKQMSQAGDGIVTFKDWTSWWCGTPNNTASGVLRSKMKLAAFTSRASGPLLQVVGASDEAAETAEAYLNELLSAAFAQKQELQGSSLGIFGTKSKFRLWCSHLIQNPLTDRLLVLAIFGNVALMAAQTPGEPSTVGLAVVNFGLMVVFTAEMGMRIVANGLVFGETAYLSNAWDSFDFLIINAVWALYAASLYLDIDKNVGFGLAMLRSFRALRFFSHIRNIISSIIAGRDMIGSVLLLLAFLFMLIYVVGFQLFHGVMGTVCYGSRSRCDGCGEIIDCPSTLQCSNVHLDGPLCHSTTVSNGAAQNHTPAGASTFGFDTFGASILTVASITTFDGWFDISVHMRGSEVTMRRWAWPGFASAAVGIGLFTVNLFVAGLAYSFIKIRKTSRNLDAQGNLKKSLVERLLNDKVNSGAVEEGSRHFLQLLNPAGTRAARRWSQSRWFLDGLLVTVFINVGFMAADHHNPSEQTVKSFEIAEAIFTVIYTSELLIKLQALGFGQYFSISLNRLDFVIVISSLFSYWLLLFSDDSSNAKGSAVLRLLRVTKVVRAARVAKVLFRSASVREMVAKAFTGLDAIFSLLMFMFFILTLAAIAGRELFHNCPYQPENALTHQPNFKTFSQSFLVSWQIMTLDSWTGLMIAHVDCAGNIAYVYFVFIASTCAFVLGNLFVAIFMENFEIQDEEKRDMQVGIYMQMLAQDGARVDSKGWVKGIQKGIQGVEDMLTETNTVNVLRRRTLDEFLKGAKLTTEAGKYVGKRTLRIRPIARQVNRCSKWWSDCRQRHKRTSTPTAGQSSEFSASALEEKPTRCQTSWKQRQFWIDVVGSKAFYIFMLFTATVGIVDTILSAESSGLSTTQHSVYMAAKVFITIVFALESIIKVIAYRLLGDKDPNVWPSPTTCWELFMTIVHVLAGLNFPYAAALLPLRACRIIYMVKRLRLMVEAFVRSLSAVWTALVLMAASFLAFGIVGMNLYSGLLWYCLGDLQLDRKECAAAGLPWVNRAANFDNIIESSISLFTVWSLQGWTTLWYWAMDVTYVDEAPAKDSGTLTAFVFFASFIMWNSLMLTNLFTSMLCDYFAQSSGSVLMTSEQRNWQFMSMFLVESLKLDVIPPPDADRWFGLASIGFSAVHSKTCRILVDLTIVASIVSMVGQQAMLSLDPTGLVAEVLLLLDEFALIVFTLEALFTLGGLGAKTYFREFQLEALVCATMWATTVLQYLEVHHDIVLLPQLQAITFIRAVRIISVLKRVNAIKKIHFLVAIAWPQVINLCCIMVIVFIIFAAYATMLCGDLPHTSAVTDFDNFDTVRSSFRVLFQLCTGMSMLGINYQCAEYNGKIVIVFFMAFFFLTNMLLVNLFIALLLDNFDLMGSEDMAVSDMDIQLFKRRWVRYAGGSNGEKHRQTIHDSISLAQVRKFVRQPGMGTFSMMPQADPFYFNRVVFELHPAGGKPGDYTVQDVLDCQRGSKDIRVFFFDLLLALCHIRFSSSCLTLANEVTKSALLVEQSKQHAARIIQVGARAFVASRSVNVNGERSAPGFIWVSENKTGENPMPLARLVVGQDYEHGPSGRCTTCTLPHPWCGCKAKQRAAIEQDEHRRKLEQAISSGDRQAISLLRSTDISGEDNLASWDQEHTIGQDAFKEIASKSKHTWDCAVRVAMFLTLRSLINVDRITPEHVVSDAFNQLQSVVDKRRAKRGVLDKLVGRSESVDDSADQYDRGNRVSRKSLRSPEHEITPEDIMQELRKLADMRRKDALVAFREHDEHESGCVSCNEFGTALASLGMQLSTEQLHALDGVLDKEEDGTIDYEDFLECLDSDGIAALEAKLVEANVLDKKKSKRARKGLRKKKDELTADNVVFSNPLSPDQPLNLQRGVSFDAEDNQMKFVNPLAASFDDDSLNDESDEPTAAGSDPTDDPEIDEADEPTAPLKSGGSMLKSLDAVDSSEQRKIKSTQRTSLFRYKVSAIGKVRTAMEPDSPELVGFLEVGEVIIADERQLLANGVGVRINGSRFGADYAFTNVTAPDGSIMLEFLHDDAIAFVFKARKKTVLTTQLEYSPASAAKSVAYARKHHCGKLRPNQSVEVHSFQSAEGIPRLKLHDDLGWTTLVSERGEQLLEPARPLDMLRLHLHSLTLQQLRREAVNTYQVDPITVDRAGSEVSEVDPKGAIIALCVKNWKLSTRGTDFIATLLRNADGLFEMLSVDDRAIIHAPTDPRMSNLHGKLGRVKAVKKGVGGSTFVDILMDGEGATRSLDADLVMKRIDEAAATSLFDAVLADDRDALDRLLASTTVPSDAILADQTPIPAGHARVTQTIDREGHTLYEVATAKRKKRCSEYLACRLMFQAVMDDDVEGLRHLLQGAGSIDAICPQGAFNEVGVIATFDGKQRYPRSPEAGEPLIERARRVWECNGAPANAESAKLLGGRCWFVLSELWEDRFGTVYTAQKANSSGDSMATGIQSMVTASRMRKKLEEAKDVRANKSDLEATLQWKERNAFMTRKTTIS